MANTLENTNPLIKQLVPAAEKGKTVATITVLPKEIEECFNLSKEGFYIHPINYKSRQSQCELKVEWTHPITCKGAAVRLLAISQKANIQSNSLPMLKQQ